MCTLLRIAGLVGNIWYFVRIAGLVWNMWYFVPDNRVLGLVSHISSFIAIPGFQG